MVSGKIHSVPLNILSSVYMYKHTDLLLEIPEHIFGINFIGRL